MIDALEASLGLRVCDAPFPVVARAAEGETWTRDPVDRIIVAQAALARAPLLTKDRTLHAHYDQGDLVSSPRTNKVTWSSSDESVAIVVSFRAIGLLVPETLGEATIEGIGEGTCPHHRPDVPRRGRVRRRHRVALRG